jgi:hypothetical protein
MARFGTCDALPGHAKVLRIGRAEGFLWRKGQLQDEQCTRRHTRPVIRIA